MDRKINNVVLLTLVVAHGCAAGRSDVLSRNQSDSANLNRLAVATAEKSSSIETQQDAGSLKEDTSSSTELVAYLEEAPSPKHLPEAMISPVSEIDQQSKLTLETLEGLALANNPTLVQSNAQVDGARGAAHQAGLFPNPVIGYSNQYDRIGQAQDETWNGGFVSQEFVTGGKLRLSRAKWCQRVQIAQTNVHAQQYRVLNDVRMQFYRALAAQQLVEVNRELLANGEDNLQTLREMLNVGQANQPDVLRAEVELQRDRLSLKQAEFELDHAWRTLTSMIGVPELIQSSLAGSLEVREEPIDWDSALSLLMSSSPELQAAWQKIQHDQITIEREQVEPIPNVIAGLSSIRSSIANTTETTFNVGVSLPIFDRNQGTVRQAQADLMQSHAAARRLELELRSRLAAQFRIYQSSLQSVQDYETKILPKARSSHDLLHGSYMARRVAWPDVLAAQRFYLNLRQEQIGNLVTLRESDVAIKGMLLTGGLTEPSGPVGAGHIDAVPKPR